MILLLLSLVRADFYECSAPANATVTFGGISVACGTVIPYSIAHYTSDPPVIAFDAPDAYYVVGMVDPDAPSAEDPSEAEVRHWLVGNVDNGALKLGVFDDADVISSFVNPAPPNGTGFHRYVQLVYKQPAMFEFVVNASITNFNITQFAQQYDLEGPIAANYFRTQYPDDDH